MTWVKVFKNGPSKICGWQPLRNLKWYGLQAGCLPRNLLVPFLNILTHILLLFCFLNYNLLILVSKQDFSCAQFYFNRGFPSTLSNIYKNPPKYPFALEVLFSSSCNTFQKVLKKKNLKEDSTKKIEPIFLCYWPWGGTEKMVEEKAKLMKKKQLKDLAW